MRAWLAILFSLLATAALAGFSDFGLSGFSLSGGTCSNVAQIPVMTVTPSSYAFGTVTTGSTRVARFTLSNTGKGSFTNISTTKVAGIFRTYSTASCEAATLTSNTCRFNIAYTPTAAVLSNYSSRVYTAQYAAATVIPISGTGIAQAGASDDFTYTNGSITTVAPTKWQAAGAVRIPTVNTNTLRAISGGINLANWISTDLTNDHCSQITVSTLGSGSSSPTVRSSLSADTNYRIDTTTLYKFVNGSNVGAIITSLTGIQAGDIIKICVSGTSTTTLKVYKNGSQWGATGTDSSSPITSGYTGVAIKYNDAVVDNWVGSIN